MLHCTEVLQQIVAMGHKRTFRSAIGTSALPPESGHSQCKMKCPLWAIADISRGRTMFASWRNYCFVEPFLSIHAAPVGSGLSHERRRHNPVAAAAHNNMGGAVGRISTRHDCQLQAALSDALVPLRFRLHSRGRAPDYATDNPCVASASADYVARGTTTAAASRHAGTARGNQRAIISNLDSRT